MRKFYVIGTLVAVFLAGGIVLQQYAGNQSAPKHVNLALRTVPGEWRWDQEAVQVNQGDRVTLTVINDDLLDHGLGLDGYGISRAVAPGETVVIEFTADRKGRFNFYCSVPCGQGEVAGEARGHFDMRGSLEVV